LLAGEVHPPVEGGDVAITKVEGVYPVESDDKSPLTYTLNSIGYRRATKEIKARDLGGGRNLSHAPGD
jgi:hypothetical protein